MEDISTDSPEKHPVGNGIDKTLIVPCESPVEDSASAKLEKRILALETTLQQLGGHFIKYQEDVTGILVQECTRLTQQMHEQKDKLQKITHDQVQNALSQAREDMIIEIREMMKLKSSSTPMNKRTDTMSQKERASTAASEDLDDIVELRNLINEMRKEIHEVNSVLNLRACTTEKRLEDLESGISAQQREVKSLTRNAHANVPPDLWNALILNRVIPRQDRSTLRESSPRPETSVERPITELIGEQCPAHNLPPRQVLRKAPKLSPQQDGPIALIDLPNNLTRESSNDSRDPVTGVSDTMSMSVSSVASGYQSETRQASAAEVQRNKREESIQLRVHDRHISASVPQRSPPSRQAAPRQASPVAPCSHVTVRGAVSTVFGHSVRTGSIHKYAIYARSRGSSPPPLGTHTPARP